MILPEDPDMKQPLVMGDPYGNALTPKLAQTKRNVDFDAERKVAMEKWGDKYIPYANSAVAHAPDPWYTKMSQATGVSNMMTQPMWFSPLHTPQNWQIASKRREIYQWSFISNKYPCYLINYGDFSLNDINDVYTKWNNEFISRKQMYIQDSLGNKSIPDFCTKRHVKKKANRLKILGVPHVLEVTHDHDCIAIKREDVKCKYHKTRNCIIGEYCSTCNRNNCFDYKEKKYHISKVKARDVQKGDYFLVPFSIEIKNSIITTEEQAHFAGHLASDGCISEKQVDIPIFMHEDEQEYGLACIDKTCNTFSANCGISQSKKVITARSGNKKLWEFAKRIVKGKYENKTFTDEVMLLDPKLQMHVLGAYIQSDGTFNKINKQIEITTYSKNLANQLLMLCYRNSILASCSKQPISSSNKIFRTNNTHRYIIIIPKTYVYRLQDYIPGKIPQDIYKPVQVLDKSSSKSPSFRDSQGNTISRRRNRFFWKNYVITPVVSNTSFDYEGWVYDIRLPPTHTVTANGVAIHQCRFFYENEPKVAAAIDFYCFTPETQVLLPDGTQKSISSIKVGEKVRSHTGKINTVKNKFVRRTKSEDILKITYSGVAAKLKVTPGHKLLTKKDGKIKYVQAYELKIGDCLLTPCDVDDSKDNYISRSIIQIEQDSYSGDLYDLEIENDHSYVVNKISCSNSRFPMNGFRLECPSHKILKFFEHHVVKRLNLNEKFKEISSEYFMLGDVFIHMDIDCATCFPKNTMITTSEGHKSIESICVGDKVLTFDNSYNKVIATMSRQYDGNMIKIKLSYLPDIICTSNHEIFAVRGKYYKNKRRTIDKLKTDFEDIKKIPASDLELGDYVVIPIKDNNNIYDTITFDQSEYYLKNKSSRIKIELKINESLTNWLGWYVGEGSTDSNRTINLSLNGFDEQDIGQKLIEEAYDLFGVKLTKQKHYKSNVLQISGYNRALSAWLDDTCGHGAANKKVPFFIFHADKNIQMSFVNALQQADGHTRKTRNERSITTISRTLSYDLIRLLHNLGISAWVTQTPERTDERGIHHKEAYCVGWTPNKTKEGRGSIRTDKYQFYRIKEIKQYKDSTTVFNFTVEKNHNYVANGIYVANCHGSAIDPETGEMCNHPDGSYKRMIILNPDWVEVQQSVLSDEPAIVMIPDEELKRIVFYKQPKVVYDRIPDKIKELVLMNKPIPLSNRTVSHIKHMPVPYGTYGSSLIRRLFTTLAYKTKIMTANWIVAERLILPVRVVKIGSDNRPATSVDIADVQQQLAQTANDPNMTIITHHNFEYEWYGASGKILQVTQEMEYVGKELLDGFMLNQSLLNGEMCYSYDTEVLTDDGFKKYDEVKEEDSILTYSLSTKRLSYEKPERLHVYDFDGNLIHFSGEQIDVLVTPNHRMLVRDRLPDTWKVVFA